LKEVLSFCRTLATSHKAALLFNFKVRGHDAMKYKVLRIDTYSTNIYKIKQYL
jgi:hypothetical protein